MIELKNSKTTYLGRATGGEKYALDGFIGAVQMREPEGEWQDIKPQLVRDADGWHIEGAPYYAEIKDDGTRLFCPDRNEKSKYLRLPSPVYFASLTKNQISNPTRLDRTLLPNQITMPTDWGEYRIIFSNTGMHFEVLFAKAPPADVFGKDSPKILFDVDVSGFDVEQLLKAKSGTGIPRPRIIPAGGPIAVNEGKWLDWSYKNGQLVLGFNFSGLAFPILLRNTTIEVGIGSNSDSCRSSPNMSYWSDGSADTFGMHMGYENASYKDWSTGNRYQNVTIPQGSTIDTAYETLYAGSDRTITTVRMKIYGDDEDNCSAFTSYADYWGRPLTTAYVDWNPAAWYSGNFYNGPEIKTVVQEIVDRGSWSSGNALAILHRENSSDSGAYRSFTAFWSGLSPTIHIEYSEGGATAKTAGETGSGADGSALLATTTRGETGGGVEGGLSLLASLTEADSGGGVEQNLLSFLLASVDSGTGIEAVIASLAELIKSDSGSDTEGISGRGLVLPDSGNGNDIISALIAAIVAADTGGSIEQSVLLSIVAKVAAETGAGADAAELVAEIIAGETGLSIDSGVIVGLKQLLSGDGGNSIDALKALIATSRSNPDMKLPGRQGKAGIPSKGVSL